LGGSSKPEFHKLTLSSFAGFWHDSAPRCPKWYTCTRLNS